MPVVVQAAPQVAIYTEAPPVRAGAPIRNGPSFGLSAGLATGVGPTLGIPFGQVLTVQLTVLPIALPEAGAGGSGGVRFLQYVGRNPRARMYVVEGAAWHGWDGEGVWAGGVGVGVDVRRDPSTGRSAWFDVTVTAFGADELIAVAPLPQAGVAWAF
jgi:hypothetical protein